MNISTETKDHKLFDESPMQCLGCYSHKTWKDFKCNFVESTKKYRLSYCNECFKSRQKDYTHSVTCEDCKQRFMSHREDVILCEDCRF